MGDATTTIRGDHLFAHCLLSSHMSMWSPAPHVLSVLACCSGDCKHQSTVCSHERATTDGAAVLYDREPADLHSW